jgi:Inhibitor of apoptosis-promoting Bax1
LFALGSYLGRHLSYGLAFVFFILAFVCLIGMRFTARNSPGGSLALLAAVGLSLGVAMSPTISYYAATNPEPLRQAGGATALFMVGAGAVGYATRRDLSGIARELLGAASPAGPGQHVRRFDLPEGRVDGPRPSFPPERGSLGQRPVQRCGLDRGIQARPGIDRRGHLPDGAVVCVPIDLVGRYSRRTLVDLHQFLLTAWGQRNNSSVRWPVHLGWCLA